MFLFFLRRALKKRENVAFAGQPPWVRELSAPRPLAELEGQTEVKQLQPAVNVARRQIEDLIERDPDRVAQRPRKDGLNFEPLMLALLVVGGDPLGRQGLDVVDP